MLPLSDPNSGITIYSTAFTSEFFQNLVISPSWMDDGTLVVKEKY